MKTFLTNVALNQQLRFQQNEKGFTLLEYVAGATVLTLTVWAALNQVGVQMEGLLQALEGWIQQRATDISNAPDIG